MPQPWISDRHREIGDRVRLLRLHADLTQDEVIRRSGLPRNTYLRVEGGATDARLSWLIAIADAIGVPLPHLVGDMPTRG